MAVEGLGRGSSGGLRCSHNGTSRCKQHGGLIVSRGRGGNMAGEIYKRADGKFGFRVKTANGQVVATNGGQGYSDKSNAR